MATLSLSLHSQRMLTEHFDADTCLLLLKTELPYTDTPPGSLDTFASRLLPVSMLMSEDLPTLDLHRCLERRGL